MNKKEAPSTKKAAASTKKAAASTKKVASSTKKAAASTKKVTMDPHKLTQHSQPPKIEKKETETPIIKQDYSKIVVFSGPSGAGKSTIIQRIMNCIPNTFGFS
ncbi:MAG: guanylate kinase, partial [Streblomastix strix]